MYSNILLIFIILDFDKDVTIYLFIFFHKNKVQLRGGEAHFVILAIA